MMIGIKDIMQLLGVGRPLAERYARQFLGKNHHKGEKFVIPKQAFVAWVEAGMK